MKKTREYKISCLLSIVAIALFCVAGITGLIPSINPVIEEVCFGLGFSFSCLGVVFLKKSEKNNNN